MIYVPNTISIIFTDYRSYSNPADIFFQQIIFICIPRLRVTNKITGLIKLKLGFRSILLMCHLAFYIFRVSF